MDKIKRNERIGAMARILTAAPNHIFTLGRFCGMFEAAKSTVSEDVELLRKVFAQFDLGQIETVTGAAGGVRFVPRLSQASALAYVQELCGVLSDPGRVLPGNFLYIQDLLSQPDTLEVLGAIMAGPYFAAAPDFVLTVETKGIPFALMVARALGVRLHTHVAETRDEEQYTLERFGLRPLAYLEQLGWTGPDVWYAHGIHFNDAELDVLAATGTGVAHCPISNMKLSSGVCRVPDMLRRGVPVGLAVDGAASNDGSNLLEELRVCYLLHRLHSSRSAPTGDEILKLATRGSARLLGRDDIGCLAAGMAADCFLIDLNRVELAGAQFDPMSLLGTVGFKGPVDYTIVNGVPVVQHGELVTADEAELTAHANETVCRYLKRL